MMKTAHLGEAGPHPVIASAARELLNKSDNERSGVLSTAMSFLGLYRDPVVAEVTRRCDWRIADIVGGKRPSTLYLVVPPSDINRTKPLIFVRFWLTTTPALPEPAAQAARAKAGERYEAFIAALGRRLASGPKLRQEISEDIDPARDAE
ncbi:type IV secretory system conjugative DNA transfer family protein [Acidomonas methanolica]